MNYDIVIAGTELVEKMMENPIILASKVLALPI